MPGTKSYSTFDKVLQESYAVITTLDANGYSDFVKLPIGCTTITAMYSRTN
jgi:hypothetical protein